MCDIDQSICITLLTSGRLKQPVPKHQRICQWSLPAMERHLFPGSLWNSIVPRIKRIVHRLRIGYGKGKIWHSTYYTLPGKWDGMQVVIVADMIHERYAGLFNGTRHEWFRERKRNCILTADTVLCISETTRQDIHHFYGIDVGKIQVTPLACSEVFRLLRNVGPLLLSPIGRPFLLYVGSRGYHKNFSNFLSTYSIWTGAKEVGLVVVGENWTAAEEQRLVKLGIRDRVHLIEHVDDVSLCHLYNQAIALVYPSLYEGFGIPLLEAMACGCPVVASRIPSTIEVAGECPIYFEPNNKESLLTALDMVLFEGRDSTRVQMGLSQVKRYSWDKTARQTLDVYRELYRKMDINDVA